MASSRRRWPFFAWITLFGLILTPLIIGAYLAGGTESAIQMIFVGGFIAWAVSTFTMIAVMSLIVIPWRLAHASRRRVSDRLPLVPVFPHLRTLPQYKLPGDGRQVAPRASGR